MKIGCRCCLPCYTAHDVGLHQHASDAAYAIGFPNGVMTVLQRDCRPNEYNTFSLFVNTMAEFCLSAHPSVTIADCILCRHNKQLSTFSSYSYNFSLHIENLAKFRPGQLHQYTVTLNAHKKPKINDFYCDYVYTSVELPTCS